MSKEKTIKIRQAKLKKAVLEQLMRTPIIEIACEKVGISRMTFYRWTKASKEFAKQVEEALFEGRLFISDIAESQLFSLVKDKKIEAIKYVLRHNNPRYADRLELSGTVSTKDEPLTATQKGLIRQALKLSSLRNYGQNKKQQK
ncbi:MAG: hypothetical protein A3B91_00990 [Candidatus Yanofskybacteria bacterium RIFCSPHIGHO2_02_FULL_41_29]|nr:MAG: hypothetical protein A3B91_00990 [Candidatus Yanofskybacteria bacterium RIFCSPHIGHO2_02_FULL_41_29]OGN21374.1 MAG: hypothetical protein A2916_03880 [Candidatus Yanofskybacteria bacterium RIFCSPLOWO2_01_FULL_41_67]OGN28837.1 MAG: hypothetical protein A3H54_01685 [Candidatus Yanofskybacteria bacterium RIFCSPLOWO2_02_FULL_41_13]OGN35602.1 MAG: hypothetical protein A3F98_02620 [Candidatus Yanofskybacteria bacterium RIFCSPLOWO2_12_FULL_41_8]